MPVSEWTNCIINLNSMSGLWGVLVAKIFVIRFFPQKLFGKIVWKIGWKICGKNVLENLFGKMVGNVGWKICLEKCVGNVG